MLACLYNQTTSARAHTFLATPICAGVQRRLSMAAPPAASIDMEEGECCEGCHECWRQTFCFTLSLYGYKAATQRGSSEESCALLPADVGGDTGAYGSMKVSSRSWRQHKFNKEKKLYESKRRGLPAPAAEDEFF